MAREFPQSGKRRRPKVAVHGKRYHCAKCRKRSPKPIKTPAPWYCAKCLAAAAEAAAHSLPPGIRSELSAGTRRDGSL